MTRLALPTVTLCAVTSVNLEATVAALQASMAGIDFAQTLLLTDRDLGSLPAGITRIPIRSLNSGRDYSTFMLRELSRSIASDHCLVVQWDGFVVDPGRWDPDFLQFDFIGAPWPQFSDGRDVGNGGFSLRSRKLLDACATPGFLVSHPEDVAIGRINREYLEREHDIKFADRGTASRFAFERSEPPGMTFGFHGVFNMVRVLGEDRFWNLCRTLDERSALVADYRLLMKQAGRAPQSIRRRGRLTIDRARQLLRRSNG